MQIYRRYTSNILITLSLYLTIIALQQVVSVTENERIASRNSALVKLQPSIKCMA